MSKNKQLITYAKNPVAPISGREQYEINGTCDDKKLITFLRQMPYDVNKLDVLVYVNDCPIPRDKWDTYELPEGENNIVVKQRLHGGDDSNPLAIILTIALIVVTYGYAAPYLAGAYGGAEAVWAAAIVFAGTALINAVFPPTLPKFDAGDKPSPTYSLSGSRNQSRIGQPMPLVVGRHKVTPDLAAKPYTSNVGKDVFLHQVFNFGLGDLTLSSERIGNTPIDNHEEIDTEESVGDTGVIELFPTNVDSVAGAEMRHADGYITRTTSVDTTRIALDFTGNVFRSNDDGTISAYTVRLDAEYRKVGDVDWLKFGHNSGPRGGRGGRGGRGVRNGESEYYGNTNELAITGYKAEPVRKTYYRKVEKGQYEVRVLRVTKESDDVKIQDSVQWGQMRSFQPDNGDYTGQKRYAVEVRASGQFNGVIDQFNAIVENTIPSWNGVSEVPLASSNPADIFIYLARGNFDANGRLRFGAGLPDSQIDLDGLREWKVWCDTNGLECNFVFDREYTMAEMLALVARCGRASPTWQKGVLGVVYDEENRPVVQQFGMANIVENSFEIRYITQKLADQITVKFFNEDIDWQPDTVTVNVPGVVTPAAPVELELAGITNPVQAEAEANLLAARQFYNRRRVSFTTDIEGLVCSRGDVISVSHDLTNWGQSGRLRTGTFSSLTLDRDATFEFGNDYYISIRHPDGTIETVDVVNPSTGTDVVTSVISLGTALSVSPAADPDNEPIDYIYTFDPLETPGFKLKIVNVEATDDTKVRITAVDERPEYYNAANNAPGYIPPDRSNLDPASVTNFTVNEEWQGMNLPLKLELGWDLENADSVLLSVARNNEEWINFGTIQDQKYTIELQRYQTGDVIYLQLIPQAVALTKEQQQVLNVQYVIQGQDGVIGDVSVPNVTGLQLLTDNGFLEADGSAIFEGKDVKVRWNKTASEEGADDLDNTQTQTTGQLDGNFLDYEVVVTDIQGVVLRTENIKDEQYIYTLEKNKEDNAGNPLRKFKILVYMRTTEGLKSAIPASLQVYNPPPAAPTVTFDVIFPATLAVTIAEPQDLDFAGIIIHADRDSNGNLPSTPQPGDNTLAVRTTGTTTAVKGTAALSSFAIDTLHQFRVAAYDDFDDTDLNYSPILFFTPTKIESVDIADGAIDTANFAAGIRPVEILASLPTLPDADYPQGAVVFLTTDNKLYRSEGSDWTVATDGADITADSITAGKIQAGAIGADEIAANAITTDKLAVVSFGAALNSDRYFGDENLESKWFSDNAGTTPLGNDPEFSTVPALGVAPQGVGRVLRGIATDTVNDQFFSEAIPLDQTKTYYVSVNVRQTGIFKNYLLVAFYDDAGNNISSGTSDAIGWGGIGTYHYWGVVNDDLPLTWTRFTQTFGGTATTTVPSNATSMRIGALTMRDITTIAEPYFYDYYVQEVIPSALIEDGAISTAKLQADSVTADEIDVNNLSVISADMGNIEAGTITLDSVGHIKSGQTDYDTGTGFWLGRDGVTPKFSLGDSAGDNLTWNGSTLTVSGDIILQPDSVDAINIADGATMRYYSDEDSNSRNVSLIQPDPRVPVWTPMFGGDFSSPITESFDVEFLEGASTKQFSLSGSIKVPWVNKGIYDILPRIIIGLQFDGIFDSGTGTTILTEQDAPTYKGASAVGTTKPYLNFAYTARLAKAAGTYAVKPVCQFLVTSDTAGTQWDPLSGSFTVFDNISCVIQELRNTQ